MLGICSVSRSWKRGRRGRGPERHDGVAECDSGNSGRGSEFAGRYHADARSDHAKPRSYDSDAGSYDNHARDNNHA